MKKNIDFLKVFLSIALTVYFLNYAAHPADFHFIDGVNIVVHEGGHFMLAFFGEFLHILGGPLLQVALPIGFVIYYYKNKEYFSSSILLFWVGQNIINTSVYEGDAIMQNLPLLVPFGALGTETAVNDWTYLLSSTGLLNYTNTISYILFAVGVSIIVLAAILSFINAKKSEPKVEIVFDSQ